MHEEIKHKALNQRHSQDAISNKWSRIYGFDLFISFKLGNPPLGTQAYASDLARRLMGRDFTVFFSELSAPPGEELDSTITHALKRSRVLVVVVNEGALLYSSWVRKEVETFRLFHPKRPIVVINVDSAIERFSAHTELEKWLRPAGRIWINESKQAIHEGLVRNEVVDRVSLTPWYQRANTRLRATVAITICLLIFIASFAVKSAWTAEQNFRETTAALWASEGRMAVDGYAAGGSVFGILKAIAAYRLRPTAPTERALIELTEDQLRLERIFETPDTVYNLATTPDRSMVLASVGLNGRIIILRTKSLTETWPILGSCQERIADMSINSKGDKVALACGDGSVTRLDMNSGTAYSPLIKGHTDRVFAVAWSPSDDVIISSGFDRAIRIWNGISGKPLSVLHDAHLASIHDLAFSPDGGIVVSVASDGTLRLWSTKHWLSISNPIIAHKGSVTKVAFMPNGRSFVTAGTDGVLQRWSISRLAREGQPMMGHAGPIWDLAISHDGKYLASGGMDGSVRVWDTSTGASAAKPLIGHLGAVTAVTFGASSDEIISAGEDRTVRRWLWHRDRVIFRHGDSLSSMDLSTDNRFLATGDEYGTLKVLDINSSVVIGVAEHEHQSAIKAIAFNPTGSTILSAGKDGSIHTRHTTKFSDSYKTTFYQSAPLESLAISENGHISAIAGWNSELGILLDGTAQTSLRFSKDNEDRAYSVVFSPNGRLLAVGGLLQALTLIDFPNRTRRQFLVNQEGPIRALAWMPDGSWLAAADDESISLWDIQNQRRIVEPMHGHDGKVLTLQFSPDGRHLISGADDGRVRIWDVKSGRPIASPIVINEDKSVIRVRLDLFGKRMFVAEEGGTVSVWPLGEGWVQELCGKLQRNIGISEWRREMSSEIDYIESCPGLSYRND